MLSNSLVGDMHGQIQQNKINTNQIERTCIPNVVSGCQIQLILKNMKNQTYTNNINLGAFK